MKKLDRRIKRTRRLLSESLQALILEKGYDAITVQDITERADLSRATFYLHYRDKEDLLVSSLEEMFDALVEHITPLTLKDDITPSLLAFQNARDYSDLYRAMLSERGVAYVMHRIRHYLATISQQQLQAVLPAGYTPPIPVEIVAYHIAGSLFGLIVWWLENDMPHPVEYMAQTFHKLTAPGIYAALGLENELVVNVPQKQQEHHE